MLARRQSRHGSRKHHRRVAHADSPWSNWSRPWRSRGYPWRCCCRAGRDWPSRSQITTSANQLLSNLRYARNEAVTRIVHLSACARAMTAAPVPADPRGWQRGYLIFADTDGDRDRTAGETLLRVQDAQPQSMRLHSTAGRPAIRFRRRWRGLEHQHHLQHLPR